MIVERNIIRNFAGWDRMSCYSSSGCNNQRCSQSQKVSIGIVVDSVAKSRHDFIKDA